MKNIFIDYPQALFNKIKTQDKENKKNFIICAILTLCILISFWVPAFAIVTCVIASISMIVIKGVKKVYILVYLLPFYHVIKLNPSGFVLCSIVLVVAIILLGIEFIIDIIRKNKKIDYLITGLFGAIVVYILLPIGPFNLINVLKLISTMAILYLVYVNKEDLDFKHLVYTLLIALLIACSFSPLRYISSRLECFLPDFPAYVKNHTRFSGLTADPNYFAVEILLLMSCLTQLYFAQKIKNEFYFEILVLFILGFLTISKAYFITFCVFGILTIIALFIKRIKNKEKIWKDLLWYSVVVVIAVIICLPQVLSICQRFVSKSFVFFETNDGSMAFNTITTGRSELWIKYIKEILSSPKGLLFGHGIGGVLPASAAEVSPHNVFIEFLYYFGLLGSILMLSLVVILFIKTSKKSNRKYINFISIITIMIMLFSLNALISFRLFILIILLSYSLNLSIKEKYTSTYFVKEEKKMDCLISIIIPAYNAEKTISACLQSVIYQDYKNLEIIVVNDGSKDRTLEICNEYQEKDKRIKVFTKENGGGPSPSRNYGLDKATGEYVCFVDSDDTICVDYISGMINQMDDNDLVIADINVVVRDKDVLKLGLGDGFSKIFDAREFFKNNIKYIINENKPIRNVYSKMFRLDKINEKNLRFNENIFIGEDYLFVLEYIKLCDNIKMLDSKLYNYFHMKNSITKKYQQNLFKQIQLLMNRIKEIYGYDFKEVESLWNNFYISNVFSVLLNTMRYAEKSIIKEAVNNIFYDKIVLKLAEETKAINKRIKLEKFILKKKSYKILKLAYLIFNIKKVKYYEVK